jgi:hypothetical protein
MKTQILWLLFFVILLSYKSDDRTNHSRALGRKSKRRVEPDK